MGKLHQSPQPWDFDNPEVKVDRLRGATGRPVRPAHAAPFVWAQHRCSATSVSKVLPQAGISGIVRAAHKGAQDFVARAAQAKPQLASAIASAHVMSYCATTPYFFFYDCGRATSQHRGPTGFLLRTQEEAEKSRKRYAPYGVRSLHSSYNPRTYTARTYHANYPKARI